MVITPQNKEKLGSEDDVLNVPSWSCLSHPHQVLRFSPVLISTPVITLPPFLYVGGLFTFYYRHRLLRLQPVAPARVLEVYVPSWLLILPLAAPPRRPLRICCHHEQQRKVSCEWGC